jgi:RimJ/RimL family protein N-acetyltransferase
MVQSGGKTTRLSSCRPIVAVTIHFLWRCIADAILSGVDTLLRTTTEHLVLRPVEIGDAAATAKLMTREIAAQLSTWPCPMSVEEAEAKIAESKKGLGRRDAVSFAIMDRSNGELIGWIGFWMTDSVEARAKIGFWIGAHYRGRGWMGEAAAAALPLGTAFLGARIVEGAARLDNPASISILTRLGMTFVREETVHFEMANVDHRCAVLERRIAESPPAPNASA